jgi:hypothetical protein
MTLIVQNKLSHVDSNSFAKEKIDEKKYYISLARRLSIELERIEPSAKMRHLKELECDVWFTENLSFVSEMVDVANGKTTSQNEDVLFSTCLQYSAVCHIIKLCNKLNTSTIQKYKICQLDFNNCE